MEEKEMIYPVTFIRPDTCPVCGGTRSLELFDVYGKPVNYGIIVSLKKMGDERYKDYLDEKRPIYLMKCKRCGEEPLIYWENGFPTPMQYKPYLDSILNLYGY